MQNGIRQRRTAILLVIGTLALVALAGAIVGGYWLGWGWTGVGASTEITDATRGSETTRTVRQVGPKTLWDWMSLLIVPLVLAIGGYIYNRTEKQLEHQRIEDRATSEQKRAEETQREAALQTYLDQMADVLLKGLRASAPDSELRDIARIRTLTTLRRLDSARCSIVFRFLHDAKLVTNTPESIVSLTSANFSQQDLAGTDVGAVYLEGANLERTNLEGAYLVDANLEEANLVDATLEGAKLRAAFLGGAFLGRANLDWANLREATLGRAFLGRANLEGAFLIEATLEGAYITNEQLATCKRLNGATLPDGTNVPDDVENPFQSHAPSPADEDAVGR